jgi:hypothetical protein
MVKIALKSGRRALAALSLEDGIDEVSGFRIEIYAGDNEG